MFDRIRAYGRKNKTKPMTHRRLCRIIAMSQVLLMLFGLAALIAGCVEQPQAAVTPFIHVSLDDIPGVTEEQKKAVDELREKYGSFEFGALASTEAFYDENGRIRGYSALFCEWLTELFDINFSPALYEWGDLFPALKADFTGDLTYTQERQDNLGYLFTDAIAERSTKFFRIAGSTPRSEIIKTRPLKLAFLEGSTTSRAAIAKLEETETPYEAYYINDYETAYSMIKSGEADAFIHEMVVEAAFDEMDDVVVEDFLPLIYEPVSLATQNPELKPIIDIVQLALKDGSGNHFADLYDVGLNEYARHKLYLRFTPREIKYLRDNSAVAYLAEFDNYPLSFYNTNEGEWQGIAADILAEITALTGLTFEPINEPNLSFSELMKMLENGEGEMISELIYTTSRNDRFIWPEHDTMRDNYVAISLESFPTVSVQRIMQLKVGVQTDTAYSDLFMTWFPNHPNVVEYPDVDSAFEGLELGEVDILMYSMRNLLTATNYHEHPGFKANIVFDYTFGSLFGFNVEEDILCSIVDKAMGVIDVESISSGWLRKTFDYRSKILQSQRPFLIGTIVLFLIVIILVLLLYMRNRNVGRRLDKLVIQRTAELNVSRQELATALKSAEMANRAKSAFLATMSHEIRTPLNAIIGIAQIALQRSGLPKEYLEDVEKIYSSGNSLLGIINDILDMSKVETGKLEIVHEQYDTPSLINDAVQLNMVRIGSKPIDFMLDIDEELPLTLCGDELRLKQILNNLLSNAIKYTEKGYVKLSVSHSVKGNDAIVRFTVEDTGQGIKPDDFKRLFTAYSRFNEEANRTTEGTGLGLSITKRLTEMMGGSIEVRSEYGKGSTFIASVKQEYVPCNPIGPEIASKLRSFSFTGDRRVAELKLHRTPMPYGKVLVVDDMGTNLHVAKGLLLPYQLSVETVESGFEAIERVEKGKTYDIIFMDHMMPRMDGIETTLKLREMGYKGKIVSLTANALAGNDKMFAQNGFDGFISKPMDIGKLDDILNEFIRDCHLEDVVPSEDVSEKQEPVINEQKHDPQLQKLFCRDMSKAVVTLRETADSGDNVLFATTAHAMKSVLLNMGEREASQTAAELEKAGKSADGEFIRQNTEGFINTLESLIQKYNIFETDRQNDAQEDSQLLKKHLKAIIEACDNYDDTAAFEVLNKLKGEPLKSETKAALDEIHEKLFLHSDFEAAGAQAKALSARNDVEADSP